MHCQRQAAQQVVEQGGDCVLALKGDQGTPHVVVRLFPDGPAAAAVQATQVSKGHGRIETRVARVSAGIAWLQERHDWPGLQPGGQGNGNPAAKGGHGPGNPLLPAEPGLASGAVQRLGAWALGN